jgi:hypothetical protein
MKTLKLIGIIALSALIIIFAASCEGPLGDPIDGPGGNTPGGNTPGGNTPGGGGNNDPMPGSVIIKVSSYGEQGSGAAGSISYLEEEMTAEYTQGRSYINPAELKYQWYTVSNNVPTEASNSQYTGTTDKFKPIALTGTYTVRISHPEYEGFVTPVAQVTVKTRPAYINFFGTWQMSGASHGNWKGGYSTNPPTYNVDEKMVIADGSLKLTNNINFPSSRYTSGDYKSSADLGATYEFINYTITGWATESTRPVLLGSPTVSTIYKLNVTVDGYKGYKIAGTEIGDAIYLILLQSGEIRWGFKTSNIETPWTIFTATASTGSTVYDRTYVRDSN